MSFHQEYVRIEVPILCGAEKCSINTINSSKNYFQLSPFQGWFQGGLNRKWAYKSNLEKAASSPASIECGESAFHFNASPTHWNLALLLAKPTLTQSSTDVPNLLAR